MAVLFGSSFSPALDLNFAGTKSLIDSISGRNLISYSRNSTATYVGSDGLIKTAAINEPRFDHDPVTGESLGLLIEEASTNSILWSDLSPWASEPFKLLETGLTGIFSQSISFTATYTGGEAGRIYGGGNPYGKVNTNDIVSIFVKKKSNLGGNPSITLRNVTSGSNAYFNLDTLTTGTTSNFNWINPGYQNFGNGWYRFYATFIGSNTTDMRLYMAGTNGNVNQAPIGTSFYLNGFQTHSGTLYSYIPTAGTAVTRQADVASITGSNFTRFFNNQQGTLYFKYRLFPNTASIGNRMLVAFADSIDTFEDVIGLWGSGTNRYVDTIGNGSEGRWGVSIPNSLTQYAIGYQVGTNTSNFAFNGALQGAVSTTPRTFNGLFMGGGPMQYIPRITYWSTRLQDKTLQVLTR